MYSTYCPRRAGEERAARAGWDLKIYYYIPYTCKNHVRWSLHETQFHKYNIIMIRYSVLGKESCNDVLTLFLHEMEFHKYCTSTIVHYNIIIT